MVLTTQSLKDIITRYDSPRLLLLNNYGESCLLDKAHTVVPQGNGLRLKWGVESGLVNISPFDNAVLLMGTRILCKCPIKLLYASSEITDIEMVYNY